VALVVSRLGYDAWVLVVVVQALGLQKDRGTSTRTGPQCCLLRCCLLELGSSIIVLLDGWSLTQPTLWQQFGRSSLVDTQPWQLGRYVI
jgi:hypothetical protein